MALQRVYVIWTHPLFREGTRLILDHPKIEWLGETSDFSTARDEINNLLPDTIIVEEDLDQDFDEVINLLENCPWNLRVISLNLNDNRFSVFNHEERVALHDNDLLRSILRD